jgi:hypothetical protein
VERIRIHRPTVRRERPWHEVLPPGPKDPDVVRAQAASPGEVRRPPTERVHLWCRAGTSATDLTSARPLLTAACWAPDIRVSGNKRYAQLITLDVIRHVPPGQPDNLHPGQPDDREQTSAQRAGSVWPHAGGRGDDRDPHVGLPGHQTGGPPGRLPS